MRGFYRHKFHVLLWDENGVALAFTMTVFLLLYLSILSIYGLGDVIQKRITMQNAADSAVYSGAVVQADTLSRVAVINKAMAWTYVMQTRVDMDYIVHKWLAQTISAWDISNQIMLAVNLPSCCSHHKVGVNYYAGYYGVHGAVQLLPYGNKVNIRQIKWAYNEGLPEYVTKEKEEAKQTNSSNATEIKETLTKESIDNIVSKHSKGKGDSKDEKKDSSTKKQETSNAEPDTEAIKKDIEELLKDKTKLDNVIANINGGGITLRNFSEELGNNIKAMNKAEEYLIEHLHENIKAAMEMTMKINASEEAQWEFNVEKANSYFKQLTSSKDNERRFLNFVSEFYNKSYNSNDVFGRGAEIWMNLKKGSNGGMQRSYTSDSLQAKWVNHSELWIHPKFACIKLLDIRADCTITAGGFRDIFYTTEEACPQVLKPAYFKSEGAISAALACPCSNPYGEFMNDISSGIYSAFTVGEGKQMISAVACARAGYRLQDWEEGNYKNVGEIDERWNLCLGDWDAAMLPVNDAASLSGSKMASMLQKIGCTRNFVPKPNSTSYTTLDYSKAINHVYH